METASLPRKRSVRVVKVVFGEDDIYKSSGIEESKQSRRSSVGFEIVKRTKSDVIHVRNVRIDSRVYAAGVRSGDRLVTVDGEFVGAKYTVAVVRSWLLRKRPLVCEFLVSQEQELDSDQNDSELLVREREFRTTVTPGDVQNDRRRRTIDAGEVATGACTVLAETSASVIANENSETSVGVEQRGRRVQAISNTSNTSSIRETITRIVQFIQEENERQVSTYIAGVVRELLRQQRHILPSIRQGTNLLTTCTSSRPPEISHGNRNVNDRMTILYVRKMSKCQ